MLPSRPGSRRRRPPAALGLDLLEPRLVPAVSAFFDPAAGALRVVIDEAGPAGQNVAIAAVGGWTRVAGDGAAVPIQTPSGTMKVGSGKVRSISVDGSSLDNRIDVSGVRAATFPHLADAVEVRGGAGSDRLIGGPLGDRIWGGEGDDSISGLGGNDRLSGGPGQDVLDGGPGDDFVESADGERDVLLGGPGANADASDAADVRSSFLPHGLTGEYFADGSFDTLGTTRTDPVVDFRWGQVPPYTGGPMPQVWTDNLNQSWYVHYAVRWTGRVVPEFSETYTFHLTVDDGAVLWVNDRPVVSAWKDQGPTEYSGQIDLAAGEPARIKLVYYNAWFGGTVKLRWSSPSRADEVIPAARLIAPDREAPPAVAPVPSLAGRVTTQAVALPAAVNAAPRGGWGDRPNTVLAPLPGGGYKLGWTDTAGTAHISTLDSAMQIVGTDVLLPGLDLRGLVAHADGFVGVMGARQSYQMVVLRLDPAGNPVFETALTGLNPDPTQGTHLDTLWTYRGRLVTSGTTYAVHFAHIEPHGHQGGYYAVLDFTGRTVTEDGWTVSHSLDQRLLYHQGQYFTMSLGDTYPRGFHFANRTLGRGHVIYPAAGQVAAWDPGAANLGGMVSAGRNIGVVVASRDGASKDLFYLLVDTEGRVLRTTRLTRTAAVNESVVRIVPYGKNLLVAWQVSPTQTRVAVINYDGRFLNSPVIVNQPLPGNDDLVAFANGDVGWVVTRPDEPTVGVVRIRV